MLIISWLIKIVITNKIIKVWSWKKINCSIKGDLLSWRKMFFQVIISKKNIIFYNWSLNSMH